MTDRNGVSEDIRSFVREHFHGWNHDEWMGFIHGLAHAGHDVSDPDGIGLALEQERLRSTLRSWGITGLGPKRIDAVARAYGSLQNLKGADGTAVAERAGLPKQVANEVASRLS